MVATRATAAVVSPGPRYVYGECPDCQYSVVMTAPGNRGFPIVYCRLCWEDCQHRVTLHFRPATAEDRPEGYDARSAV